ncbi:MULTISPECIES: hypothetical protein [unclassified Mycobacterium]|uniref:hypothetical protein n=1 Tax=unclassified Mycobacterium TaxID=2642494 RepID=UPI0029C6DB80|nr:MULTISPECIES: hypothetical protein [unclassified Mycobacterium]
MTRGEEFLESVQAALDSDSALLDAMGVEEVRVGEVRVLCPRGHFIANVAVIVLNDRGIVLRPRGTDKDYFGDVYADPNHGFRFEESTAAGRLRVRLRCKREKCSYAGAFDFEALGRDLRVAAASAGHAEYRLTN